MTTKTEFIASLRNLADLILKNKKQPRIFYPNNIKELFLYMKFVYLKNSYNIIKIKQRF